VTDPFAPPVLVDHEALDLCVTVSDKDCTDADLHPAHKLPAARLGHKDGLVTAVVGYAA
jgi:hypothetical protein